MARIDRHTRARLVILASILVLLAIGAVRPESYPILRLAILIPGAFLLVGLLLLGIPLLAGERAEGHDMGGRRLLDFLEHNWLLPLVALIVIVAVAFVSFMELDSMTLPEKLVFFAASGIGIGAALLEWFRDLRPGEGVMTRE